MHVRAWARDIVPFERRHRDRGYELESQRRSECGEVLDDGLETLLSEIDEVHLVDRNGDFLDAQQGQDAGMAARLGQDALTGIDQQHTEIAIRRSRGHIARVLHMAWGIGNDELPPRRREIAVSHVDGDALLALRLQAVDQERQVEFPAPPGIGPPGLTLDVLELVLEHESGIVKQSANQRALAIVHTAASQEAQQPPILLGGDPSGKTLTSRLFDVAHDTQLRH